MGLFVSLHGPPRRGGNVSRSSLRRARSRGRSAFKGEPDRHQLYQWAVQEADNELLLFDRVYRRRHGRLPRVLREDFCGTGLVACHWAQSGAQRIAYGLDLDAATLAWGRERNVRPLGPAAARIDLRRADVRSVTSPRADVICALNFSYSVFHQPRELVRYLIAARKSLAEGGVVILDAYGGWEAQQEKEEPREVTCPAGTFTYVWHQAAFNPIDNRTLCHIHFEVPGWGRMERAFT